MVSQVQVGQLQMGLNDPFSVGRILQTRTLRLVVPSLQRAYPPLWLPDTSDMVSQKLEEKKFYLGLVSPLSGTCKEVPCGRCYSALPAAVSAASSPP